MGRFLFRFVTIHGQTDTDEQTRGLTDRQTEFSPLDRVCIPCSAVKTNELISIENQPF